MQCLHAPSVFNHFAVASYGTGRSARSPGRYLLLTLVAVLALALGLLVYILDRTPGSAYLLPAVSVHLIGTPSAFGVIGEALPSFVHTFAFGILTAIALGRSRRAMFLGCGAWWLIGTLFEIGQHPVLSGRLAASLPTWFSDWPLLNHVAVYFTRGTFDPVDLLATALGAFAAAIFFYYVLSQGSHK